MIKGSVGPENLTAMYEARKKLNDDRRPGLVDFERLRVELLAMHGDNKNGSPQSLQSKYPYLYKSSPFLFDLIRNDPKFQIDQVLELFNNIQRVERNELSNEQLGEIIVRSSLEKKAS